MSRQDPFRDSDSTVSATAGAQPRESLAPMPVLTVLHHPAVDPIGAVLRLSKIRAGGAVLLSRQEPDFVQPRQGGGAALSHRRISREPHVFSADGAGGVRITPARGSPRLTIDGAPCNGGMVAVTSDRLERGVVLELAGTVVLLLHLEPCENAVEPEHGLVGESAPLQRVRRQIGELSDAAVPVLLTGESGTGKELVARALHAASPRKEGPFVAVNVASISPTLAAAELFGHVRGAFTGAEQQSPGLFEVAAGGTLFLDEIGDASSELQVALLRASETGEIVPVGSRRALVPDVRLIAATDADLATSVASGTFRNALLHRLSAYRIEPPPLRERRDDVGRLFVHFLRGELEAIGALDWLAPSGEQSGWVPASLVARLARYDWPGNVRELRNVVRQLCAASRAGGKCVVPPEIERLLPGRPGAAPATAPVSQPRALKPAEIDATMLLDALARNDWRVAPTARELGIARNSLLALIERSEHIRRPKDLSAESIEQSRRSCGGDLGRMARALGVSEHGLKIRMRALGLS
jgi:two-component system nitrogen regulation response regulator GlnG